MNLHNLLQSILLLGGMAVLLAFIGWVLAGPDGIAIVLMIGLFFTVFGRGASKEWMLKAIGARKIDVGDAPGLYAILDEVVRRAELEKKPKLYLLDSEMMLGFSAGRNERDAAVVLTGPLVQALSPKEIAGVLAHEISHIHAGDLVVMGIADLITRMTRTLSLLGILLAILKVPIAAGGYGNVAPWSAVVLLLSAPLVSFVLQMALSRSREFDADLHAVDICGDPQSMADALEKLEVSNADVFRSIFLPHKPGTEPSLLRSHPVTEERVKRIMAQTPARSPLSEDLVGAHHGFPSDWPGEFGVPIRWLLRWWR